MCFKRKSGKKQNKNEQRGKLGDGIKNLQEAGTDAFAAYFIKVTCVHIFFDVLFAVLFINLMIFYSPIINGGANSKVRISTFFGNVLLTCGMIFLIITFVFVIGVLVIARHYIEGKHKRKKNGSKLTQEEIINALKDKDTYKKAIITGIIFGLVSHAIMGVVAGLVPTYFTGVDSIIAWIFPGLSKFFPGIKGVSFTTPDRVIIGVAIFVFGLGANYLTYLRYKRVNWNEVTKDETASADQQYTDMLSATMKSAIAQVAIVCLIIIIFAAVFKHLDPVVNGFEYYNLMLALIFGIISTYVTIVYKKEFFGDKMPGFTRKRIQVPETSQNPGSDKTPVPVIKPEQVNDPKKTKKNRKAY